MQLHSKTTFNEMLVQFFSNFIMKLFFYDFKNGNSY